MAQFEDLFEYNEWANQQVLTVTDDLSPEQLAAPMPELGGSALDLLAHTAKVEAAFLGLMMDDPSRLAPEMSEYARIREVFATAAAGYRECLPGLTGDLGKRFEVPWFGRQFTVEQALLQVATHSVQHRAGICAGIARAGKDAPNLDYIHWLYQFR